ncbi:MAG: histidine kinase [Ornithinimicrobium sp.]
MSTTTLGRLEEVLGSEEDWERPGPSGTERVVDVWVALGFFALAALGSELLRSIGVFADNPVSRVEQFLGIGSAAVLLVWRRTYPVTVAMAATLHLLVVGSLVAPVVASLPMQVLYFFAIYSGVAWAKDRRVVTYVVIGLGIAMFAWVAWFLALSSGVAEIYSEAATDGQGPIPPTMGVAGWIIMNNLIFFGGAVLLGQVDWRRALRTGQVIEQAQTIETQGKRLQDQAVVNERLRIARELHDVVAHHISVMGVQAAAARRVLATDGDAASEALRSIEGSSRDAVDQMRDLLGTLRSNDGSTIADGYADPSLPLDVPADGGAPAQGWTSNRSPEPGLHDLAALAREASTTQCSVEMRIVPQDHDVFAMVAAPVQLSVYRIAQEALANVRKHSTARSAHVAVRIEPDQNRVEVEIVDSGAPRRGTTGTGLGQLGMSERTRHLGGGLEVGSRRGGGYRVRAWLPMDGSMARHRARESA